MSSRQLPVECAKPNWRCCFPRALGRTVGEYGAFHGVVRAKSGGDGVSAIECARPMKPLPIKPNLSGAGILRMRRVTWVTRQQAIAMECRFQLLSKLKFWFNLPFQFARGRMKQSRLKATLTDLTCGFRSSCSPFGIGLLAALA